MKKTLAFLLAALLTLSVAGACLAEVTFPLSEPVTFRIVVKQGAQDLSTDYAEKKCYQELSAKTNVVIDWMEFKTTSYAEKVVQMIGANDLPDAISGGSMDVMANYEVLVDLRPYLESCMPNWKAYLDAHPEVTDIITMTDGGIYALPVATGSEPRVGITSLNGGMLFVNDTFLNEQLGGKIPQTMDEFYAALKIAKTTDFNGNGLGDEIPLLACNNYREGLDDFFRFYGLALSNGEYIAYGDDTKKSVEFLANQEAYKACLRMLNQWYTEGLINSDVYSMSYDEYSTRFFDDSSMVAFCINYSPDQTFSNGLTDWTPILYLENGEYENVIVSRASYECKEGFAITKACKNPEILCAFVDAINDDFETWAQWRYGNKDEIWAYAEDGVHYYTYLMGKGLETGLSYGKTRQTYSAHLFGPSFGGIYEELKIEDPATEVKGAGRAFYYKYIESLIKPETVRETVLRYGYWEEDLDEELDDLNTQINTFCAAFKANAVVKGFTDADWDAYVKQLNTKLQLNDYIDLYNQYLTRND